MRRRAFTLVELVAVIVVLAILAIVAVPRFLDAAREARISAALGARGALASAVAHYRLDDIARGGPGDYPASLEFALQGDDSRRLFNPWWRPGMPVYNVDNGGVAKWYVQNKTIELGMANGWGAIWYNPDNGRICLRVPQQASDAETLALFNLVNSAECTSLGQTSK